MSLLRLSILVLACCLCALPAMPAEESTATVHFDQLGSPGAFECALKDVTFYPVLGYGGRISYFQIRNQLLTPREMTVKITGLAGTDYDLYVGGGTNRGSDPKVNPVTYSMNKPPIIDYKYFLVGKRTKAELEAGISVKLPGTDIPQGYRAYFEHLRPACASAAKRYVDGADNQAVICWTILGERGIVGWCDSIQKLDARFKTVDIAVVPAGGYISLPGNGMMPCQTTPSRLAPGHGFNIQKGRKEVQQRVTTSLYRFDALEAMTPVDVTMECPAAFQVGVVAKVRARLYNWTDRSITGKVTLAAPSGWKVKAGSIPVTMAGMGKAAEAVFEVTPPKGAKPDQAISATAELLVEGVTVKITSRPAK